MTVRYTKYIVMVLAAMVLQGCSGHSGDGKSADRVVKVSVIQLADENFVAGTRDYVGTIEEGSSVDLGFAAGGRLTKLAVKEGQKVKKGQLLATIDNSTALNSYFAAQATLSQAEDAYNRAKQVYDKGSLPEVKWVEMQTKLDQARSVAAVAGKNVKDCALYAPRAGVVADCMAETGAMVSPLQPVVRIVDMSTMCAKMSVPECDIANIQEGDTAIVTVNALEGRQFVGVITQRDVTADPLSHSYMVKVWLLGKTAELLPGMVCRVTLEKPETSGTPIRTIIIPNRAVQLDSKGERYVWLVDDSNRVKQQYVGIGDLSPHGVVVSSGLEIGDRVVTDGTQKVATGTKVEY